MKNNTLQLIEAIFIAIAAIGTTSIYQQFCQNIKSAKRRNFWKFRNAERLIFAAAILILVLGYATVIETVIILSAITIISLGYDTYYVKSYINTPFMNSPGHEITDVAYFFIKPMLMELRKSRIIELEGMKITLIKENGYDFELCVVAEKEVTFPWQLHFGVEKIRLKKGSIKLAYDWLTDTNVTYTVTELQAHCFDLTAGTELISTITLSEKI